MAEKQINITIAGDVTLEKNVQQSKEIYDNIQSSYETWQKFGKTEPLANQDKIIDQLKAETKLLEQVNKQIVLNEKANKKDKETLENLQTVLKQEVKTIKDAQEQNTKLRKARNLVNIETEEGKNKIQALNTVIDKNNTLIKQNSDALTKQKINIGNYKSALEGAKNVAMGFGLTVGGIELAAKAFTFLNEQIDATNKLQEKLKTTLGITGDDLDDVTTRINVLTNVYQDIDVDTLSTALNTVVKELGISESQALTLIEEGFAKGSNANGEFLDTLKEYPGQFAAAKIGANEMFSIINKSVKEGIYSDKGSDAIKEGLLRLREMTPATKEALLSIGFTSDEINAGIQNGTLASFEGIQQVSEKISLLAEGAPQTGQALADIFGGPGEDAGYRYIAMLKDIDGNLDNVENTQSALTKANIEFQTQWQSLITNLASSDGEFSDFKARIIEIAAAFLEALQNTSELKDVIDAATLPFKTLFEIFKPFLELFGDTSSDVDIFTTIFKVLAEVVKTTLLPLNALLAAWKAIIKLFTDGDNPLKTFAKTLGLIASGVDALTAKATENTITNYRKLAAADAEATDDIKDNLAERAADYQEYIDKINDLEQLRINSLEDGFIKEADQIDLNYKILREKYKGQKEALLYIELAYENEVKALRTEFYGDEVEAIERITGLADPKNAATEINKNLKKVVTEVKKDETSRLDSLLMELFKVEGDDLDKLKAGLTEIYNSLQEGAQAVFDLRNANLENKLSETEALKEANESELQSEQDKLTELQSVVDEQSGIEKQRTQNQINAANERIAAKKKEQIELENQEKLYQEKIKKQQKIAIYTQLAIDTASSIGSLVKYSQANPGNLLTGGITGQLQLAAGLITIFSNMANARAQIKKLRKGGKLTGATHEYGGIPLYEAEGGEFVINRNATKKNENTLAAINQNKDYKAIQNALNKDFGQDVLKQHNLSISFDTLELKRQNRRLHLNNQYLKRLVNIAEKEKQTVAIGDTIIEISKNSIKKTRMK
jgi:DNA repair exonuclease SbcCD ATPase subunit